MQHRARNTRCITRCHEVSLGPAAIPVHDVHQLVVSLMAELPAALKLGSALGPIARDSDGIRKNDSPLKQ